MEDSAIISLYFSRSEKAISETDRKYGAYCFAIANNILSSREDSEESVNDTYLAAWNTIPPQHPNALASFLGKITRYISLDRWKKRTAAKRGGGELPLALEELGDCVSGESSPETVVMDRELNRCVNHFLEALPETERKVFVCRYWYLDSIEGIGKRFGFTESKVKSMLYRLRGKLRGELEEEGFV